MDITLYNMYIYTPNIGQQPACAFNLHQYIHGMYKVYSRHILVHATDIACTSCRLQFCGTHCPPAQPSHGIEDNAPDVMMKLILSSPIHKQCWRDSMPICPSWRMMSTGQFLSSSTVFPTLQVIPLPNP